LRASGEASARAWEALWTTSLWALRLPAKQGGICICLPANNDAYCICVGWPSALVANYLATRKSNIHVASHNKVPAHCDNPNEIGGAVEQDLRLRLPGTGPVLR